MQHLEQTNVGGSATATSAEMNEDARATMLERLDLLAQALGGARELPPVYRALKDFVIAETRSIGVFISLYDAERRIRTAAYAWSGDDGSEADVAKLPPMPVDTEGPNARAIRTKQVVNISENFMAEQRGAPVVIVGEDNGLRPQSALIVPMLVMGRVVGTLEVQSYERAAFTDAHLTVLRMAANLAAAAIENVQLLERERRLRDEAERQRDIAHENVAERHRVAGERDALLREAQSASALLDTLFQAAPVGLGFWDRDLRFVRVNSALADIIGLPPEAHLGKTITEILPGVSADVMRAFRHVLETGEVILNQEAHGSTPAAPGVERFWLISYYPVYIRGEIVGVGAVCDEITEEKRAEAEREKLLAAEQRARAQAEEASRLKDEFLATVSHELRTPLTAILGWLFLLRSGGLEGAAAHSAVETIERNARLQAQLIEDLLDVSRIITGKLHLDARIVEPSSFIEAAVESILPAAGAKGVCVETSLAEDAGKVFGDPARLQQVVWNLLSNAVKFTPRGGSVRVELTRADGRIVIAVSDTGQGINAEFLPHVFDRFRQANQSSSREHGGLGLGLAIVRHLVELHGGAVSVESEGEGKGATFTVSLPVSSGNETTTEVAARRRSEEREKADEPQFDCDLEGVKLLIVDDDPDTLEMLRRALGRCGAAVVTAANAQEALARFEETRPDVLISDIGMPFEDGYELIRRVRSLPVEKGGKIPAVALTAYARLEDRLHALRAGYQLHVPKPVEIAELVAVVANLAESRSD